jgi:opacity protein-like surface antigen
LQRLAAYVKNRFRWIAVVSIVCLSAPAWAESVGDEDQSGSAENPRIINENEPGIFIHQRRMGISLGVQGGLTYFTEGGPTGSNKGVGKALHDGPNTGIRASFEIFSWLAIDGRFVVTSNDGNALVGQGSLATVGGFSALRVTLPFRYVRPYLFGGYGGYRIAASGANTLLVSSSVSAYAFGLGAVVPVTPQIQVGFEAFYSHLNGETLSRNPDADGGDPDSFSLFAQYRFGLGF